MDALPTADRLHQNMAPASTKAGAERLGPRQQWVVDRMLAGAQLRAVVFGWELENVDVLGRWAMAEAQSIKGLIRRGLIAPVEGQASGAATYYALTPAGETLRAALAEAPVDTCAPSDAVRGEVAG